jgi:hypothetical protein
MNSKNGRLKRNGARLSHLQIGDSIENKHFGLKVFGNNFGKLLIVFHCKKLKILAILE